MIDPWFNVDAGFERDALKVPANCQQRVCPFRIDGCRGPNLVQSNVNVLRSFSLADCKTMSFRVDVIDVTSRTIFSNPNATPMSRNFGRITTATASTTRFIQCVTRFNF